MNHPASTPLACDSELFTLSYEAQDELVRIARLSSYKASFLMGTITAQTVPIPATFYLFGSALGLLGWMRRKLT